MAYIMVWRFEIIRLATAFMFVFSDQVSRTTHIINLHKSKTFMKNLSGSVIRKTRHNTIIIIHKQLVVV